MSAEQMLAPFYVLSGLVYFGLLWALVDVVRTIAGPVKRVPDGGLFGTSEIMFGLAQDAYKNSDLENAYRHLFNAWHARSDYYKGQKIFVSIYDLDGRLSRQGRVLFSLGHIISRTVTLVMVGSVLLLAGFGAGALGYWAAPFTRIVLSHLPDL